MSGIQYLLIFGIATAAFAAVGLAWRTRRPEERVLYLLSLGVYIIGLLTILRLSGARSHEEAESACRVLYLTVSAGTAPWLLLATIAQGKERWAFLQARGILLGFAVLIGLAFSTLTQSDLIFNEVWISSGATIVSLGLAAKMLLLYLTAAAAYVLTQVETLLRAALRLTNRGIGVFLGLIGLSVIVYVYVATESFLYGMLASRQLAIASLPASLTCLLVGITSLRHSFDDMRIPVGRGVVYSSFTLFLLGLLMLLLGVLSRVTEVIGVSVDRAILIAISLVALVLGFVIWVSPAWKRRVAEFIDENFYVNRYDYRKEWARIARRIQPSPERESLVRDICETVSSTFGASQVCLGILNTATGRYNVYDASGKLLQGFSPPANGDLASLLLSRGEPVALTDLTSDLDVIPGFVENRSEFERLGIATVVPMVSRTRLDGFLLLSPPLRGGLYTPEDLGLMTVIGADLANTVRGHLLMREAEDRREGEALVRLSSFVLHDLKNCISSIRGAVEGAERYMDRPEFRRDLIVTLSSTVERMTTLMNRLTGIRGGPKGPSRADALCDVTRIVRAALDQVGAGRPGSVKIDVDLSSDLVTRGDAEMLERVFVNLFANALEAIPDGGTLTVAGRRVEDTAGAWNRVVVRDTGCGMTAEFMAESLFRPFVSTKKRGLGIGLYQCKNIIEDHSGTMAVSSQPRQGTTVEVLLPSCNGDPA